MSSEGRSAAALRADLILRGSILTMDPSAPRATGVALRAGRILALGDDAALHPLAGPETRTLHLGTHTALPGFHDAHVHLTATGAELEQIDLSGAATLEDALELVRARANETEVGGFVRGAGFSLSRWGLNSIGHREADALDSVAAGRQVVLTSQDHHSVWASRKVLAAAGISAETAVEGGLVVVEGGEATGLLLEEARRLIDAALPATDRATIRAWLKRAARHFASRGVTTVHHMAYEPRGYFRELMSAASSEEFPVRVWACLPHAQIEAAAEIGLATGQGGSNFLLGGAKFFADGALGSRTAWMLEPYLGGGTGMAIDTPELLRERVPLAIEAGLTPVIHAIGDAATRTVVDLYERTAPSWRAANLRPRLEHAQHMHEVDVRRAGALGIVASMQPVHLSFDAESIIELLGDRLERAYPLRSLMAAGATLAFGSDSPVAPVDVFGGLRAAARRVGRGGASLGAAESISPDAALYAHTAGAAYAAGMERRSGRLAPGYDADLVILSHDPTVSLDGLEVVATMKGGAFTFGGERLGAL